MLHVRGYGHDSHHVPVTESTLFRIASLSKSFTSLAVLQLVDAGKLSLDDPVATHLPEFRPADPRGAGITVRQLLDQTSGLADREVPDLNRPQPTTLAEATTSLNSAHLVAAPGPSSTTTTRTTTSRHAWSRCSAARHSTPTCGRTSSGPPACPPAYHQHRRPTRPRSGRRTCGRLRAADRDASTRNIRRRGRGRCQHCGRHGALAHRPRQRRPRRRRHPPRLRAQPQGDPYGKRTERLRARLGHRRPCRGPDPAGAQRQPAHLQRLPGGPAGRPATASRCCSTAAQRSCSSRPASSTACSTSSRARTAPRAVPGSTPRPSTSSWPASPPVCWSSAPAGSSPRGAGRPDTPFPGSHGAAPVPAAQRRGPSRRLPAHRPVPDGRPRGQLG